MSSVTSKRRVFFNVFKISLMFLRKVFSQCIIKQLLVSAFVISGIMKVEVSVISLGLGFD